MRVRLYIDGFNMYGAIADHCKSERGFKRHDPQHLKWLSYRSLSAYILQKLRSRSDIVDPEIDAINLYTTLPDVNYGLSSSEIAFETSRRGRHQKYISAMVHEDVRVHHGKFKEVFTTCKLCKGEFPRNVEKETDVHVAVDLVADSLRGEIDVAIVLSGDSDLGPAFETVRNKSGVILISVVFAPRTSSRNLDRYSHQSLRLTIPELERHLLPEIVRSNGRGDTNRPPEYAPPMP